MKTTKKLMIVAIVFATVFASCKKDEPLEKCVFAMIDHQNKPDNIYWSQTNLDAGNYELFNSAPKSITVPTGSYIRIVTSWNFDNYKDDGVQVSKIFVKTSSGSVNSECELIDDYNSNLKEKYFPAYSNTTYTVRFVLSNGEEAVVGPFAVTVNNDNKVLNHNSYNAIVMEDAPGIICTNNNADKVGFYYLFAPYVINANSAGSALYKADLNNSFNKMSNQQLSPEFALFGLTREGLGANQVKLVAADKIPSSGLYPELTSMFGCGLGINYARFATWNVNLDTVTYSLQHAFENVTNSLSYSDLDTITFDAPSDELIVSKSNPTFKFITKNGKKGYGVVSYGNEACSIYYRMQR